jgi:hypothetical protein
MYIWYATSDITTSLLFTNTDVSIIKMSLDTSVLAKE